MGGAQHAVKLFVTHYGLLALFVLLFVEEAGVWLPLPGDLLIVYFGYQAAHSSVPALTAASVLVTVLIAVLGGSTLLYVVARRFRWIMYRFGRFIHLHERRLQWMERWLARYGGRVIVPGRLVPGLRIPTTVVCGAFAVPLPVFVPAIAVSAVIWGALYLALGAFGPGVFHSGVEILDRGSELVDREWRDSLVSLFQVAWMLPFFVLLATIPLLLLGRGPFSGPDDRR